MNELKKDAFEIINYAINSVLPDKVVKKALEKRKDLKNITLVAIGKAAWVMAKAAYDVLNGKIKKGIVITKYGHSKGKIGDLLVYEAGHPIPDENSVKASKKALELVKDLKEDDTVLFLVSGGGSALFEVPKEGVTLQDLKDITEQLLRSGADIVEINTIRKRLSAVKGGRFAIACKPAKVVALVLSDVLGDRLDSIASGPAYPDSTTSEEALKIIEKYQLSLRPEILEVIKEETPKELDNVETEIIGNITKACEAAKEKAEELGYNAFIMTTSLDCEAREAGFFIASLAREIALNERPFRKPTALIFGGETVVHVKGDGMGGRNQELALAASLKIKGLKEIVVASVGTDGTDGPTDAAGGIVDGETAELIKKNGIDPVKALENNDSYNALKAADALIKTGPTGTNVNDITILLCR